MTLHPISDQALQSHIGILGATGGGKSYTARGLVERLLAAGRRVCVLDPVGVWWGLRANESGEGPGHAIAVIGGEHGDTPINEGMAEALAKVIAEGNLPAVIDTSEMGVGQRARFLTKFLAELYRVNKAALWLVLEEADEAAPQQPRSEGAPQLLDAVDRIARRGRSRGFRLVIISQRPQVVHKNVLTQVRTMIAHRLTAPLDIKAVEDWMKANSDPAAVKRVVSSLPSVETGSAWVWSPEAGTLGLYAMPKISTFDSSATPDADEAIIAPKVLAEIDLGPLRAMAEAVPAQKSDVKLDTAERSRIWNEARAEGYAAGLEDGERTGRAKERARIMTRFREAMMEGEPAASAEIHQVDAPKRQVAAPELPVTVRPAMKRSTELEGLAPTALAILKVIQSVHPRGISFSAAASRAGASKKSSNYRRYLKQIMECGEVTGTEARLVAVNGDGAPLTMNDWLAHLPPSQGAMLKVISETSEPISKADVAEQAGISPSSSGLGSGLRELLHLELIKENNGRYIAARDEGDRT